MFKCMRAFTAAKEDKNYVLYIMLLISAYLSVGHPVIKFYTFESSDIKFYTFS